MVDGGRVLFAKESRGQGRARPGQHPHLAHERRLCALPDCDRAYDVWFSAETEGRDDGRCPPHSPAFQIDDCDNDD